MILLGKAGGTMLAGAALLAAATGEVPAQEKPDAALAQQLAGAWFLASNGYRPAAVGPNAKGAAIFDGEGTFSLQIVSADVPKLAANDRLAGTANDNAQIAQGSLAYFGAYDVSEPAHTLTLHIYYSSFPNWRDTDQSWTVALVADQMSWTSSAGATDTMVWFRAPPVHGPLVVTRSRHY